MRGGPATLPRRFYARSAPEVARDLLGCVLVSRLGGVTTAGRIVETEAYLGPEDAASHAAFRPSSHTLFYGPGGMAYVFRAYGLHFCLNAITGRPGAPGCVLIRALEPTAGVAAMAWRRRVPPDASTLTRGPGNLTRALAITDAQNRADLTAGRLTIAPPDRPRDFRVTVGARVGITRATRRRLRFSVRGYPGVSGARSPRGVRRGAIRPPAGWPTSPATRGCAGSSARPRPRPGSRGRPG